MNGLILSRIRLKRDASVAALAPLLLPEAGGARVAAGHGLLWSLFADGPDRRRDFLWREDAPGQFMTLSARVPSDPHQLFHVESKDFAPALSPGDRLGFTLRANPVISRSAGPGQRGRRHDVVMDALHGVPQGERAEARPAAVSAAGRAWFDRQGTTHGFVPEGEVGVDGYDRVLLPREGGRDRAAIFGVLDLTGILVVRDVALFLPALAAGFGRARAFGYGLMLIRRAG